MLMSRSISTQSRKLAFAFAIFGASAPSAFAQIAFQDVSVPAGFGASASETWGAAWGDIDGDHYPDLFIPDHRTRAKLYRNNRNGTFTDVSRTVDLSRSAGWTGGRANVDKHGPAWADVDNDGDDDLLMTVSSSSSRLLINDGGLLTDRTIDYGLDRLRSGGSRQNLFLDFNGDGRLDLATIGLSRPAFSPQLSNGTFGSGSGVEIPMSCSTDAQWAHMTDINPAAGLEFLCAPRTGTYARINAFPNGVVTDVTAGTAQFGGVDDAITLDYNRDLRPDLFIVRRAERASDAYQSAPDRIEAQLITGANIGKSLTFKSTGVITLTASLRAGSDPQGDPAYIDIGSSGWSPSSLQVVLDPNDVLNQGIATGSPGINIGYLTATGQWKITQLTTQYDYTYVQVSSTAPITELVFVGGDGAPDKGYRGLLESNTSTGLVDVSTAAGFTQVLACQSAVAGDFDNDMDEDIFLACTRGSNNIADRLFMNNGNGTFTEVASAGGAAGITGAAVADHAGTSDSAMVVDYDRDGFLDLFVTNGLNLRPVYIGGPQQLFHNLGNANHWVEFDLVGVQSNRDGIGSKVYVAAGGITQYREQNGGYHRWTQNFKRIHTGLGLNTVADVTVEWPNGTSTVYSGLAADALYQLKQDGTFVVVPR